MLAQANGRFDGKVALVVGGGWEGPDDAPIGIGAAISQLLGQEGARVAVLDIEPSHAERTLRVLGEGASAFSIIGDVGEDADCKRAVDEAVGREGRLDIVINNVGLGVSKFPSDSLQHFERLLAVNFESEVRISEYAVPHMPRGGAIVNVGSVFGGADPKPDFYSISKRAVSMVATPALATRYAPKGIRVNCVTVGYLWNAVTARAGAPAGRAPGESLEDFRRARVDGLTTLGVEGNAWDVAKAVAFLASDDARWTTGQDLFVDGGYNLLSAFDLWSVRTRLS